MFNLFVSNDENAWNGKPITLDLPRCVHEYTDSEIHEKWGNLENDDIAALRKLPCIFAYESGVEKSPKFGRILDVKKRDREARIQYEIVEVTPFLTDTELESMTAELDIARWEMSRTHWAVKDVKLAKELKAKGITLPTWAQTTSKTVDLSTHVFDVALSFPGEDRQIVEQIAKELERAMGPHTYFYDYNYQAQLARPSLDTFLQEIYGQRSKLIVVFLSSNYQNKEWCGIEFRAIREIINAKDFGRVMFVKVDSGKVDGTFKSDGHIDVQKFSSQQIAGFIQERAELL